MNKEAMERLSAVNLMLMEDRPYAKILAKWLMEDNKSEDIIFIQHLKKMVDQYK